MQEVLLGSWQVHRGLTRSLFRGNTTIHALRPADLMSHFRTKVLVPKAQGMLLSMLPAMEVLAELLSNPGPFLATTPQHQACDLRKLHKFKIGLGMRFLREMKLLTISHSSR